MIEIPGGSMNVRGAKEVFSYAIKRSGLWAVRAKRAAFARVHPVLSYAIFGGVGAWANAAELPFMIEYRPDFHRVKGFADYRPLRRAWMRGNRTNNGGDLTRFYALYLNLSQVLADGVPGDLVELGVYKGNSAAVMANLGRKAGRRTYLFDTFEGFDARDLKGIDKHYPKLFADTSLPYVRNFVGEEMVTYVKGFFPDSLTHMDGPRQVAVLHIDCDLREPMKAALEAFYSAVSPGGIIIMHDYSSGYWTGLTTAVDEFFCDKPEKPVLIPDKSGTAIVRKM
jgi:hypothetical protein